MADFVPPRRPRRDERDDGLGVFGHEGIESCSTCRWFVPGAHHAGRDGTCRSHAPMQLTDETPPPEPQWVDGEMVATLVGFATYTGWPDVMASDWCGEHESRRVRRSPKDAA